VRFGITLTCVSCRSSSGKIARCLATLASPFGSLKRQVNKVQPRSPGS